ncbi:hypothetical protein [Candidatus Phycosocius spiralis]|uniref:Uncharacterized protein n=1 Tax=Candidatus Phycosocius spiralis TaxID=2815099 RepID=A0ABQ4PXU7_9PROT|nr:hypothetical protein [Candidatus Phycosocius spiralis]GIU67786.1 hypothetical protein PsB1_1940 [Candidatus Phycosocius spiralis]
MTLKKSTHSLARKIARAPKVPIEVLANQSQINIDLLKDEFELVLQGQIHDLIGLLNSKDETKIDTIYEISSQIISSSSFVKADWISKVAQSLCEIHEIMASHQWDWDAAEVHGKTMQLISTLGRLNPTACQGLLTGLQSVVMAKRAHSELLE